MNYEVKAKRRRVETEEWDAEEEENVSVHTYVNYILRALGYDEITDEAKKKIEQFVEGWVERISSAFVRNGKEYYPYDVLLIYHIVFVVYSPNLSQPLGHFREICDFSEECSKNIEYER